MCHFADKPAVGYFRSAIQSIIRRAFEPTIQPFIRYAFESLIQPIIRYTSATFIKSIVEPSIGPGFGRSATPRSPR